MAIFNKEGLLITKSGKHQVDELISKLSFIKQDYLVDFLQSIGLSVPRKLRMRVLSEVLKDAVVETIEERKSLADEMGYRLTWFNRFTDSQYVNLLEWYKSNSLGNHYLTQFWHALVQFMVEKGVGDDDLEKLFKEANSASKTKKRPLTKDFNKALDTVLFDEPGEIDGVTQDQFRPVTYKATTLTELRAIGDKYNAPIPKRLKKNEMLEVIFDKLKERKELTPELEAKLKTRNIILLERFAKDNDIKVSTELKKEEIIEYILSNAEETKSSYFVPQSQGVYEEDEPEVELDVKVEQPVKEELPQTVEPEEPVVQKTLMVSSEAIDYRPQLDKLADAFQNLAKSFEAKEFVIKVDNHNPEANSDLVEPVTESIEEPLQKVTTPSAMMVSQELIVQELLKAEDDDTFELDPSEPIEFEHARPKKIFKYRRGVGKLAAFFALLFTAGFVWVTLLSYGLLIAPFLIEINQFYADLEPLYQDLVKYGSMALAFINLIVFFRLLMKPKKGELIFWGIITLFTGPLILGLLVFLTIGKKVIEPENKETNETVRLAEAIEKLSKPEKVKTKKSGRFTITILSLLVFVLLLFVLVYGIWRLDFTYGYENIPYLGPFLRDYIIEPLFGSAHDLTQYNS